MALTYSPTTGLGSDMPRFKLPRVDGGSYSFEELAGSPASVIMFICNHCPYVRAIEDRLLALARDLTAKGARFVAICANDPTDHPEDQVSELRKRARELHYPFPYLYDHQQDVAREFGAVCTPDLFVYDRQGKLAYRGRLDDSWKDPARVTRQDLREAIQALLSGGQPSPDQIPSMGCSIKWRKP